ncbi:TonB-dependent receptor [Sphingomonas carotinifaciens]|uniref:Iron complex outermembrane recepter protein n=1 Tax=Sphingomonas carotinifaciens TaxID=1166323 RepID=A0A1G7M0Z8_9SPHN|nr:TonB-dependent receptor [Sphingomonas carotinifaciens]MBB4086964.1 iron complex outermembrane receptor protein [Sphingomonas carotinifaciens]MWC42158.1 TonB-dependent receptor [Sphingomonas carotinifaciens]SDF55294.1 iron complex outermembrane recepter protein [Sphingomonas carotinifaciens]
MIRRLLMSSAISALTISAPAYAQNEVESREATSSRSERLRPHDEASEEILVTAPYPQNQLDVLSGTSVLSGQELTRQLRPTIAETLARQPGVSATSFGPNASRPVLRGFQGERIRVLTDGIGSIDVSNTSVDHAPAVNPLTAERIEVLRGPAALLFGSSAIGGVVNVIDNRIPRRMPEKPAHFDAIAGYGSAADETTLSGVLDVPINDRIVLHLDGSYVKTGDLRTGGYLYSRNVREEAAEHAAEQNEPELLVEANARGRLANTAAETSDFGGGLTYIGERGSLGFSVSRYDSLYGVPARFDGHGHHDEEVEDAVDGHAHDHSGVRLDLRQTRIDVRGEYQLEGFIDRIRVRAAGADYRHDELESPGVVGTSFFNRGYEGRVEAVQTRRDRWSGAIGGQFFVRNFRVEGEEKFLPKSNTQQYGLFTLQSFDFGVLRAEAGARVEHSSISADADADLGNGNIARSFDAFSFSAGASYPLTNGVRIGLNASRTERAPSAEEMFANGPHLGTQAFEIGNPAFTKEASWGLEATLKGRGEGYRFAVSAYHNWFSNYIYDYLTGTEIDGLPVYQYAQADARYYGFEGELSARLATIGNLEIRGDVLGDYVRATIKGSGPAPRIPPLRLLGGVEAQAVQVNGRVEVERVFGQDRISGYETPTDGYTMVNTSLAWMPFSGNATSLILSANNIFDVTARRHPSVIKDFAPLAGRDIRLTARFQL